MRINELISPLNEKTKSREVPVQPGAGFKAAQKQHLLNPEVQHLGFGSAADVYTDPGDIERAKKFAEIRADDWRDGYYRFANIVRQIRRNASTNPYLPDILKLERYEDPEGNPYIVVQMELLYPTTDFTDEELKFAIKKFCKDEKGILFNSDYPNSPWRRDTREEEESIYHMSWARICSKILKALLINYASFRNKQTDPQKQELAKGSFTFEVNIPGLRQLTPEEKDFEKNYSRSMMGLTYVEGRPYIEDARNFKITVTDLRLIQAMNLIRILINQHSDKFFPDLHARNFMFRKTGVGPQLVITDPIHQYNL